MQGILYEEPSFGLFLLITVIMGGWAAWMTGRAIALTWRAYWNLILYLVVLGLAVRFIHFALFQGTLLSVHYYAMDTIVLLIVGTLGFRYYRARQMTTQYRWMYERTGLFTWKDKAATPGS